MHVPTQQTSLHTFRKLLRPALLACFFGQALPAAAQTLPAIGILTEEDDDDLRLCQVSHESAAVAARAALRYNRISVASLNESDWHLYINLTALPIERGGQGAGRCAVSAGISLRGYQSIDSKPLQQTYFATVDYCERGAVVTWNAATAQTAINSAIKGWVDECVAEIEDEIK